MLSKKISAQVIFAKNILVNLPLISYTIYKAYLRYEERDGVSFMKNKKIVFTLFTAIIVALSSVSGAIAVTIDPNDYQLDAVKVDYDTTTSNWMDVYGEDGYIIYGNANGKVYSDLFKDEAYTVGVDNSTRSSTKGSTYEVLGGILQNNYEYAHYAGTYYTYAQAPMLYDYIQAQARAYDYTGTANFTTTEFASGTHNGGSTTIKLRHLINQNKTNTAWTISGTTINVPTMLNQLADTESMLLPDAPISGWGSNAVSWKSTTAAGINATSFTLADGSSTGYCRVYDDRGSAGNDYPYNFAFEITEDALSTGYGIYVTLYVHGISSSCDVSLREGWTHNVGDGAANYPIVASTEISQSSFVSFYIDKAGQYTVRVWEALNKYTGVYAAFFDKVRPAEVGDGEVFIFNMSDEIVGGEAINITGHRVVSGVTNVYASSIENGETYRLEILSKDEISGQYLNALLPLQAKYGPYEIWIENEYGYSAKKVLNAPRINFLMDDEIHSGVTVMLSGRNMDADTYNFKCRPPVLRLVDVNDATKIYPAIVVSYGPYKVEMGVSSSVPVGEYYVEIGIDGYDIWTRCETAQTITVVEENTTMTSNANYIKWGKPLNTSWAQEIDWTNVVSPSGLTNRTTTNDTLAGIYAKTNTNAIKSAINSVQSTGGVVVLPEGDYIIDGFSIPGYVAVVGAGQDKTRLHLRNGDGIYGSYISVLNESTSGAVSHFGLADMTIDSYIVGGVENACPDIYIRYTTNYGWILEKNFILRVTVNGPDDFCTYTYNGAERTNRGLGMTIGSGKNYKDDNGNTLTLNEGQTYGGGHNVIKDCTFTGVGGRVHTLYTKEYFSMTGNLFSYRKGAISIHTAYGYIYDNVINGNAALNREGAYATDIHGFMHRGYEYYEKNSVLDVIDWHKNADGIPYANVGEAISAELGQSYGYGYVRSIDVATSTIRVEMTSAISDISVLFGRLALTIVQGKGMGQAVTIDPVNWRVEGDTLVLKMLDNFEVLPDTTSVYSLQVNVEGITYYDNYVNGSTKGILIYCNYRDCVVKENTLINCAGVGIFAIKQANSGNYYDEATDTWYFNCYKRMANGSWMLNYGQDRYDYEGTTATSTTPIGAVSRYNNNMYMRIENNYLAGVSPVTHVTRIGMRAEQVYVTTHSGLTQNYSVEVRNKTIIAGGYFGYKQADGTYVYPDAYTPLSECVWVEYEETRSNNSGDEVYTHINGSNHQVSGIFVGMITNDHARYIPSATPEVNKNILIESNTVDNANAGTLTTLLSSGLLIRNNDYTTCGVGVELDYRVSNKVYSGAMSNIVIMSRDEEVSVQDNGTVVNHTTDYSYDAHYSVNLGEVSPEVAGVATYPTYSYDWQGIYGNVAYLLHDSNEDSTEKYAYTDILNGADESGKVLITSNVIGGKEVVTGSAGYNVNKPISNIRVNSATWGKGTSKYNLYVPSTSTMTISRWQNNTATGYLGASFDIVVEDKPLYVTMYVYAGNGIEVGIWRDVVFNNHASYFTPATVGEFADSVVLADVEAAYVTFAIYESGTYAIGAINTSAKNVRVGGIFVDDQKPDLNLRHYIEVETDGHASVEVDEWGELYSTQHFTIAAHSGYALKSVEVGGEDIALTDDYVVSSSIVLKRDTLIKVSTQYDMGEATLREGYNYLDGKLYLSAYFNKGSSNINTFGIEVAGVKYSVDYTEAGVYGVVVPTTSSSVRVRTYSVTGSTYNYGEYTTLTIKESLYSTSMLKDVYFGYYEGINYNSGYHFTANDALFMVINISNVHGPIKVVNVGVQIIADVTSHKYLDIYDGEFAYIKTDSTYGLVLYDFGGRYPTLEVTPYIVIERADGSLETVYADETVVVEYVGGIYRVR